jgi:molecular chaperone GrpE (heat shock protein)
VFALTRAGERSGRDNLSAQLNQFQAACRDAARRVGLVPLLAAPGDKFDAQKHQLPEGQTAPADATVGEIVAPGYTFQGRRLRSVLVRVAGDTPVGADPNASAAVAEGTSPQSQLTPGAAESPAT